MTFEKTPSSQKIESESIVFETKRESVEGPILAKKVEELEKRVQDAEKSRFDIITLLGLFVALITYLGLEIQIFKTIDNPLLIIGISIFFIASILLFLLTLNLILKSDSVRWKSLLYVILIFLLVASIIFILLGYSDWWKRQPEILSKTKSVVASQKENTGSHKL